FTEIAITSSGRPFFKNRVLLQQLVDAHLHTVILFTRPAPLGKYENDVEFEVLRGAIDNFRRIRMVSDVMFRRVQPKALSTVLLLPLQGEVDGEAIRGPMGFALANQDVIRAVIYVAGEGVSQERVIKEIEKYDGVGGEDFIGAEDLSHLLKLSSLLKSTAYPSLYPPKECFRAALLLLDGEGYSPITKIMRWWDLKKDVEKLLTEAKGLPITTFRARLGGIKLKMILKRYINVEELPPGIDERIFIDLIWEIIQHPEKGTIADLMWHSLLLCVVDPTQEADKCPIGYVEEDLSVVPFLKNAKEFIER
ncbi:MAG: hypothetical protein J7L88_02730, partial [Thermoplasmata archaeon]|nr:hypothetical protein [Thermoplasmata archaeon]